MSNSALASITATYTDSENEEERGGGISSDSDSENSQASRVIIPTPISTPVKVKKKKKSLRLVSYHDDTYLENEDYESEEEEEEEDGDEEVMDLDEETPTIELMPTTVAEPNLEKFAHYGFSLPPEPKGKPPQELIDKINNLYSKMETNNMNMNKIIQGRKEFRNPSIYEKLIQFCDINEFGTNYPPEIYDPLQWGAESFYEELSKAQKTEMIKKQKEKKDSDKIEQATAAARKVEAKKRKSKWDQPAPIKTNIGAPALTTTVTGTKGTVISAFGSLK